MARRSTRKNKKAAPAQIAHLAALLEERDIPANHDGLQTWLASHRAGEDLAEAMTVDVAVTVISQLTELPVKQTATPAEDTPAEPDSEQDANGDQESSGAPENTQEVTDLEEPQEDEPGDAEQAPADEPVIEPTDQITEEAEDVADLTPAAVAVVTAAKAPKAKPRSKSRLKVTRNGSDGHYAWEGVETGWKYEAVKVKAADGKVTWDVTVCTKTSVKIGTLATWTAAYELFQLAEVKKGLALRDLHNAPPLED